MLQVILTKLHVTSYINGVVTVILCNVTALPAYARTQTELLRS